MNNNKKGFSSVLLALVVLAGVTSLYFLLHTKEQKAGETAVVVREIPEGWKEYRNDKYGIRFGYPGSWTVTEKTQDVMSDHGGKGGSWALLDIDLTENETPRMFAQVLPKEFPDSFKDRFDRFQYFHGEREKEILIDGQKTLVGKAGCYECYDTSEEEIEKISAQPLMITCNIANACLEIGLVNTEDPAEKMKEFFEKQFIPTIMLSDVFTKSRIKYQYTVTPG